MLVSTKWLKEYVNIDGISADRTWRRELHVQGLKWMRLLIVHKG